MNKGNYNEEMDPKFWNIAIPGLLGVLGLIQGQDQSRRAGNLQNQALDQQQQGLFWQNKFNESMFPAFEDLIRTAREYDPEKEALGTANRAQDLFKGGLADALNKYNADYARGGGNPGASSEEQVGRTMAVNQASGPYQSFLLNALSDPSLKRAQMLQAVQGIPAGQLTRSYFDSAGQLANMSQMVGQGNGAGGMQMLAQALAQLFNKQGQPNGADTYDRPGYRGS